MTDNSKQALKPDITRPIIGIENRTPQEVFDMMCDRIRHQQRPRQSDAAYERAAQVAEAYADEQDKTVRARAVANAIRDLKGTQPNSELIEELKALDAKATPGPWEYRPDEYDAWGVVKSPPYRPEGFGYDLRFPLAQFRDPLAVDEETLGQHRRDKTDPWRGNAELAVALRNNLDRILSALGDE